MNYLSLFSGIGGLDLGLDRAGMTCVGQVEKDLFCQRVLAKHWPEVPRHDDVRTAPKWWATLGRPAADLVAGGFPCQPFSLAGRRHGVADERWGWPWFWDVVRVVRPRYILVENVAALLRDRDAWGWILADLATGGYDAEWDCIPAAAVGAPHQRDRVFLVAHAQRDAVRLEPVAQPGRCSPAVTGHDGAHGPVADAEGERRGAGRAGRPTGDGEDREGLAAPELADAVRPGPSEPQRGRAFCRPAAERGWWAAEPDVGRVAHGVPARVDRLRGLGNAVVPGVAEVVGEMILAHAQKGAA